MIAIVSSVLRLVHAALELPRDDLVLADDVDDAAPAGEAVAVDGGEEALGDRLEELLLVHSWAPEGLADAEELLRGRAGDDEVLGLRHGADEVEAAHERLALLVEARHHRLRVPRPEALLVQHRRDEIPGRLRLHDSLLTKAVQLNAELQQLCHGLDVRGETGQPHERLVCQLEDLLAVAADRLQLLHSVASVSSDGDAALPRHCHDGRAVVLHEAHLGHVQPRR
mmetsp:Transcript_48650/g.128526  ORF Transcript_48650/g.128526 Transcript_48650/m.128526 type:complete len:225 (+) Transcript_48650:287-961(+)